MVAAVVPAPIGRTSVGAIRPVNGITGKSVRAPNSAINGAWPIPPAPGVANDSQFARRGARRDAVPRTNDNNSRQNENDFVHRRRSPQQSQACYILAAGRQPPYVALYPILDSAWVLMPTPRSMAIPACTTSATFTCSVRQSPCTKKGRRRPPSPTEICAATLPKSHRARAPAIKQHPILGAQRGKPLL
jgi:hypothetical protein